MNAKRTVFSRNAFTLIELMVVIAIIALLLGVLLPAFNSVRTQARVTQTQAQYSALDTGINLYRGESALGGSLPPSASDNPADRQLISNPQSTTVDTTGVRISGAHLLLQAMIGADGLGTPGFKDFGTGSGRDGLWWNDTHASDTAPYGAYAKDPTTGKERHVRYGGGAYVDDKMKETARSFRDLVDKGVIINLDCDSPPDNIACEEPFFTDPWEHPILYYKANPSSFRLTADMSGGGSGVAGIYRQEDNGIITGTVNGGLALTGLDFGAGASTSGTFHDIANAVSPAATVLIDDILADPTYLESFARFILDPSIKARPTPVRKNEYLFISAGPDGRYGTDDDVTNWTRKVQ